MTDRPEQLEQIWDAMADHAAIRPDCPAAPRLWELANGELPPSESGAVLDHVAGCPSCAADLRLARRLGARPAPRPTRSWGWTVAGTVLLAAGLVLLVGLPAPAPPDASDGAVYRGATAESLTPLVDPAVPLTAGHAELTWNPGPPGTVYEVLIFDRELRLVQRAVELDEPRFVISADAIAQLPDDGQLHWQVFARLPDGTSVLSPTWDARIASPR